MLKQTILVPCCSTATHTLSAHIQFLERNVTVRYNTGMPPTGSETHMFARVSKVRVCLVPLP
jgi:hypothetical protein